MAALFDHHSPLVDLRDIVGLPGTCSTRKPRSGAPIELDYRPSADLVRRFVDMRALTRLRLPGQTEASDAPTMFAKPKNLSAAYMP
jgi:hypothetical protein